MCIVSKIGEIFGHLVTADGIFTDEDKIEKVFQTLKDLLCTAPFFLSQIVNGTESVVGYFSRILSKPERNYCVTRRELLAVLEYKTLP